MIDPDIEKYVNHELKIVEGFWSKLDGYYMLQPYATLEDYQDYYLKLLSTINNKDEELRRREQFLEVIEGYKSEGTKLIWTEDKLAFDSYEEMKKFCILTNCELIDSSRLDLDDKIFELNEELTSYKKAFKELSNYFTSGNDVPVERATILTKEFQRITSRLKI